MQTVSRFEANLLRLLSFFLRREPPERALALIEQRLPAPPCLSRGAVNLVRDALSKGCTFLLAHRGGWRRERHLRDEKIVEGRLWERTPPADLALSFSEHTLSFLIWITSVRPGDKEGVWKAPSDQLTLGDLLFLFFAHEGLRQTTDSLGAPRCAPGRRSRSMPCAGWPTPRTSPTHRRSSVPASPPGQKGSARASWKPCSRCWRLNG
jgi:hypothetical protein